MAAEPVAHGRQDLLGEGVVLARAEARIERGRQHVGRHRLVDRRHERSSGLRRNPPRRPNSSRASRSSASAIAVRSSSHEVTTLPRRHTSAMSARSRSKRSSGGSASRVGVAQDVEALGIGLHQAVLDAVVDHLDEVARRRRARMDIAALDARIAALAPVGVARMSPSPGASAAKIGSRCVDGIACRRRSSCR